MSALASLEKFGEMGSFFKKWTSFRHCLQSEWALIGNEIEEMQENQNLTEIAMSWLFSIELVKFMFSKKATKIEKIFTADLTLT